MDLLNNQMLFYSILPPPLEHPKHKQEKDNPKNKKGKDRGPPPKPPTLQFANIQIATTTNHPELPEPTLLTATPLPPQSFNFEVDIKRWENDLRYLASLNRCAKTPSQIHQAGEWLAGRMREIENIEVEIENVTVKEVYESFNVIGTLKGTTHPDVWYVIGAHYDSTSENIKVAAPGALDNASGSAGVLEMARIFSKASSPFTIVFILFTGEEQGYFGSKKYVQNMFIKDQFYQIKLMLNMDMIALDDDIIIETRETNFAELWEQLATANSLIPKIAYEIWGSDHVTFANAGVPSILTCSDHSKYPHYHRTTDLPDNLDVRAGYNTITMNVQAIQARMQLDLEYL